MAEPFVVDVLRPLDFLLLRFELRGLLLTTTEAGGLQLERDREGSDDAMIVVHFPPQHIAEEIAGDDVDAAVPAVVAGPTRVGFRLPDSVSGLPFTLDALLDWNAWDPALVPVALPRGTTFTEAEPKPEVRAPLPHETAIELPYRLVLSPSFLGGWKHAAAPVSHRGRTELWHTRLVVRRPLLGEVRVDEKTAKDRDVRAVWSPDMAGPPDPSEPDMTMNRERRLEVVALCSEFGRPDNQDRPYQAQPVAVDRLMLSSAGGWLRSRGSWDPPKGLAVSEWNHVATQGRDHFVKVVEEGFLFPFGHRAAEIEISERIVTPGPGGVAAIHMKRFLIVREPVKSYDGEPYPFESREMPFSSVRMVTLFTEFEEEHNVVRDAHWLVVPRPPDATGPRQPIPFHLIGTDRAGAEVDFHAALIFIPKPIMDQVPDRRKITLLGAKLAYRHADDGGRRSISLGGKPVALAPPREPSAPGDTTVMAEELVFEVDLPDERGAIGFPFLPFLDTTRLRIPAVEQLTGTSAGVGAGLSETYLRHGFDDLTNNAGQLFVELRQDLGVKLPAERAGALANPDMAVRGLSRHLGPVAGDLGQLASGQFPTDFFPVDAQLLGAVSLKELIAGDFTPAQFPKMLTRALPDSMVTALDWTPRVQEGKALRARDDRPISFTVHAEIDRPLDGRPPTARTTSTLRDFIFNFVDVIEVHFNSLTFSSEPGRKPDVSAEVDPDKGVVFLPPLTFLNALRRFIPADGFSDPPAVDVGPAGIKVGYSLPLPAIPMGVFLLDNVRLGASLHLPFTDGPARLRFNFAERHEQFVLTVSGLGGGGFLALALGLDGIEVIEAALEFGAAVSMDFGVASGGVHIMAGVYFRYELASNKTLLTGYLRCGGEVEVLGLISVSIELFLGLSYVSSPERVEGEATLVINVEVLFFSESVELTVRRTFAKGAGDPPFGEVMSAGQWAEYAEAFAA